MKQEGRDRLFRLASGRVADTLVAVASLSPTPAVTRQRLAMENLGVAVHEARTSTGNFATACPDWTEERSHLGGCVGEALTSRLLELGWFKKIPRGRTLRLTPYGERGLARELGIGDGR